MLLHYPLYLHRFTRLLDFTPNYHYHSWQYDGLNRFQVFLFQQKLLFPFHVCLMTKAKCFLLLCWCWCLFIMNFHYCNESTCMGIKVTKIICETLVNLSSWHILGNLTLLTLSLFFALLPPTHFFLIPSSPPSSRGGPSCPGATVDSPPKHCHNREKFMFHPQPSCFVSCWRPTIPHNISPTNQLFHLEIYTNLYLPGTCIMVRASLRSLCGTLICSYWNHKSLKVQSVRFKI